MRRPLLGVRAAAAGLVLGLAALAMSGPLGCSKAEDDAAQAPAADPPGARGVPPEPLDIDADTRRQVWIEVASNIEDRYGDGAMGAAIADSIRTYVDTGQADSPTSASSLVAEVSEMLTSMVGERHFEFRELDGTEEDPPRPDPRERSEHGIRSTRMLGNDTVYLELDGLRGSSAAQQAVAQAMIDLPEAKALILDVRENTGGSGEMVVLICSHLLEPDTLLYTFLDKSGSVREMRATDPARHFGASMPVYILTGGDTRRSTEALAFILQDFERAVIVGERTAGVAAPSRKFPIVDRFELTVPMVILRYGKSGGTFAGTGVIPDIEVPVDTALEVALRQLGIQE